MTDHLRLFEDLVRLETRLWNQLDVALKDTGGVSLAWLLPLRVLDAAPGSRVLDLAQEIGISPGGASKLVDRLVDAGLVLRAPDETDRRASRLHLMLDGVGPRRRARRRVSSGSGGGSGRLSGRPPPPSCPRSPARWARRAPDGPVSRERVA